MIKSGYAPISEKLMVNTWKGEVDVDTVMKGKKFMLSGDGLTKHSDNADEIVRLFFELGNHKDISLHIKARTQEDAEELLKYADTAKGKKYILEVFDNSESSIYNYDAFRKAIARERKNLKANNNMAYTRMNGYGNFIVHPFDNKYKY